MAQTDLVLDRPRQALEHLQILAEQSEGERRTQWREMLLYHYLSLGMNERAMDLVQRLTREAPLEAKWWKGQVHLFLEEAKTRDALTALAVRGLITRLDRRETELLGDLYLSQGIPRKAASVYRRALSEGFRIETARKLVEAYRRQHRSEAALEWAEKSLKIHPGDGSLMLAKADLLYEQRRWKAAAAAYRKALPHTDAKGRLWWLMGHCAAADLDWQEARASWEKAMEWKAYRRRAGDALKRLDLWERSADRTDTE
jgi:tetratricopeptide (TPR) repeat protein